MIDAEAENIIDAINRLSQAADKILDTEGLQPEEAFSGVRYFLGSDSNNSETADSDNYAGYGFEKTGEIQLRSLLAIALVLGRLEEFADMFKLPDVPTSLYKPEKRPLESRKRARKTRPAMST